MAKTVGYIVLSGTDTPLTMSHLDGVLGMGSVCQLFATRGEAQKAINTSAAYAKKYNFTQWGCDKWRIWRVVQ